jgi:poly(3-hydroxybutyrate) depolymerase
MIYQAYRTQANFLDQVRPLAAAAGSALRLPWTRLGQEWPLHTIAGVLETFANLTVSHARLPFGIESFPAGNHLVPVTEEAVYSTPFATLLHFKKAIGATQPRVLLVAPMSGHFATLLRATVKTMLTGHDIYITDWHNVRDVPLAMGCFDFGAFVDHLVEFLRVMGPGSHVVAVCQPCVPVLAAAALMAEDGDAAQPRSMTLMAGPIDTRINPTKVNGLAIRKPIAWFEWNLIAKVPHGYEGATRQVYPGFMQLAAFMNMNFERHLRSFKDMVEAHAADDQSKFQLIQHSIRNISR